ncbi:hypothetical protein C8A01DRAFT_12137 [Parachaetomium inaequale]|uniref:Uncharacterized protein n=1 Tax=Parachaetomium inaequale TaxID=2588326 RepID=A0AAN6PTB8_9PEZI|nr:hypothetical protein C8A01DRAFT_12137 [Parachaetomium inaequale]
MEPPTKRPRFGPAPFESDPNYEDPEADELNERPEDVNARRDPAARLERSRAFAAFKLKSAFERIFEKYERDFTGVGDEIDLRTGEIVVDNGHIHSLKDAQLGGGEGEEGDSADGASEAGSLNEEERMVRGKVENRLSRVGQTKVPSIPPHIGAPPFFAGGWPGSGLMLGGPPGLPSMMYPGQMPFGGFPMQYGTPISIPTTDPTWRSPELPSPFVRNALMGGEITVSVRKKAARLSLSAAREQDDGDEDDVFLDASTPMKDRENGEGLVMKQKLLAPRPPQEKISAKKMGRPPGTGPKKAEKVKGLGKHQKAKSPSEKKEGEKKGLKSRAPTQPERTEGISAHHGPGSVAQVRENGTTTASTPTKTDELTASGTLVPEGTTGEGTKKDPPKTSKLVPAGSRQAADLEAGPKLDPRNPNVYVNHSGGKAKHAKKPRNQTLRVEIPARNPPDVRSFRILTPEPSDGDSPKYSKAILDVSNIQRVPAGSVAQVPSPPVPGKDPTPESGNKAQTTPGEAFSRNLVDPAYAFSDEDEPTLPRGRAPRRKPKNPKPTRTTKAGPGVLREISQNVRSEVATPAQKSAANDSLPRASAPAAIRAQSPTLSLHLEDVVGDLLEPFGGGDAPASAKPPAATPKQMTNAKTSMSDETTKRPMTRRSSLLEAGTPLIIQPNRTSPVDPNSKTDTKTPEAVPSKRRQRGLSNARPQETPARAPRRSGIHGRSSLGQPTRQEIPETSPNAQPVVSPPSSNKLPTPTLVIQDSDPPFSSEEQAQDVPAQLNRAPSPTLTDPSSKPQPSPSLTKQPQPSPTPHTPVKTPTRHRSKSHHATTTSTKATNTITTTKKKKTGILSLLPANDDDDDELEDELSILSPAKPGTTRSTPAGHHVRLGLFAPGLAGSGSKSASGSKLKKAKGRGRKSSALGGGGKKRGEGGPPWTPSSRLGRGLEAELVQTPGGTMRRCGEGGFRCEREFCFSCL